MCSVSQLYIERDLQGLVNFASRLTVCANTRGETNPSPEVLRLSFPALRTQPYTHTHPPLCLRTYTSNPSQAASQQLAKICMTKKGNKDRFPVFSIWAEGQNRNRQRECIWASRRPFSHWAASNFKISSATATAEAAWNASDDPSCSLSFGEIVWRERNTKRDVGRHTKDGGGCFFRRCRVNVAVPPQTRRAAAVVVFNLAKEVEKVRANALGMAHRTPLWASGWGRWRILFYVVWRLFSRRAACTWALFYHSLHAVAEAHTVYNWKCSHDNTHRLVAFVTFWSSLNIVVNFSAQWFKLGWLQGHLLLSPEQSV